MISVALRRIRIEIHSSIHLLQLTNSHLFAQHRLSHPLTYALGHLPTKPSTGCPLIGRRKKSGVHNCITSWLSTHIVRIGCKTGACSSKTANYRIGQLFEKVYKVYGARLIRGSALTKKIFQPTISERYFSIRFTWNIFCSSISKTISEAKYSFKSRSGKCVKRNRTVYYWLMTTTLF